MLNSSIWISVGFTVIRSNSVTEAKMVVGLSKFLGIAANSVSNDDSKNYNGMIPKIMTTIASSYELSDGEVPMISDG